MIHVTYCTFVIQKLLQEASKITLLDPPKRSVFHPKTVQFSIPKGGSKRENLFPKKGLPAAARSNIWKPVLAMNGKRRTCRTCR